MSNILLSNSKTELATLVDTRIKSCFNKTNEVLIFNTLQ